MTHSVKRTSYDAFGRLRCQGWVIPFGRRVRSDDLTVRAKKRRKKVSVPATLDFVALGNGRLTGMLVMLSLKTLPLSESYRQSLAALMARRMAEDPNPAG